MGPRGQAPQPAELRILKGNGRDRDQAHKPVKRQPKTAPAIPPMPDDLGEHGEFIWKHVTPELARMGILGQVDRGTLEMYCRLYQQVREHPGGHGYATLAMSFVNVGSKLGLDPASRLRMTLPEADDGAQDDIYGATSAV